MSTIRECYQRAAEEAQDDRPFSSQKFRTDGKTIFIEKLEGIQEPTLFDLKRRQAVFRTIVAPSLKDLEFDASAVARWYPLGIARKSVVLRRAVEVEGSIASVVRLYGVTQAEVRGAVRFEERLAA